MGDANKCFRGQLRKEDNLRLAENYWESKIEEDKADDSNEQAVREMLVDGQITVVEIVKEINANVGNG